MRKKIYILFLILPFLDLITALLTRIYDLTITPGLIVKGFFMVVMFFYVIFSNSKFKKISLLSILLFFIYLLCYFKFKPDLFSFNFMLSEINYLFKLLYYPIIFVSLLCLYDEYNFDKYEIIKIMKINLIIMSLLLFIPLLTNTAYSTYIKDFKGFIGWFYAGNEIANIMILLFPFVYCFIDNKFKYNFFISLPVIYIILSIGTKVSLLGIIIITIINLLYTFFKEKKITSHITITNFLIMIIALFFSYNSYAIYNYKYSLNHYIEKEELIIDENEKEEVDNIINSINKFYDQYQFNKIFKGLLSGRDIYLANTLSIYNNEQTNTNIWFGIGFSNTSNVNNTNITKLIEIDILDAYFHYGIIGLLIMFSPFIITGYFIIKNKKRINLNSIYYLSILLLILGISSFSGHVLAAPSVSIYLVLYLLLLLNEFKIFEKNINLNNKISILSLHLGYGGIEKSIVNQANMLCEKYNVEIVCLYKVIDILPYKLNKKVKVIYLSNLKPNKKEFLNYLKQKNLIKTLFEGFKSVYILRKKRSSIKKYIYNSESKIIISTRLEFTKYLNNYGNKNSVKIAEEHVYHHDSPKYFNEIKKSLKNIDYLLPTSKYLTEDYKEILKNEKVKVIYIPNIVSDVPQKLNRCNNKNIITVGRVSPEKGFKDLVHIFKIVNQKDSNIKLKIIGDGAEMLELKQTINENKLNITLTGFLDQQSLKKEYSNASLFVMTSFEESFGLVLIEAMSYGIPCFAFDSALGAKEIINGKNGNIIKNRNKNKMAQEIINYFKNNPYNEMIQEAKKTSENYSFNQVKIMWEELMDKILN